MFIPSPILSTNQLAQNLFISLFVKLKYLRQINPSTLATLLLHPARVEEKTPAKREWV